MLQSFMSQFIFPYVKFYQMELPIRTYGVYY